MILVTGATGNVGSEVVRALAAAGRPVRALVRRPDATPLPDGVEAVTGDLNRPESMTGALEGARAVFLLPGYADMPGLLAEARRAGVEHVVLLSGGSAGLGDMTNAVTRYMAASETAVRESGLSWTFLRPSAFMSNALRWLPQLKSGDQVRVPFPDLPTATIDPYDLGAVAARALLSDEYHGEILWPTGPVAILPAEQVAVLGEVLGRDLRFVGLTNEEARADMLADMPAEYVDAFFDFYVNGSLDESIVRPTVREVTGREPRTFEQWARAHADDFR
ncbi:NAD-dependent epimerase/dehydratase family protein [Actinomadura spongiicola]|uniref:NAD-dependent epimerase/dehydratase family protein n=1 Tax=Actinomadura spongiicola TaxID=2303421 RepID=A0A372GD02_9ACTN|nr:NAD(P)H-binding protein [Actinomadura spongiicola]RFS83265.1 NAD-dependent epimerase/dehydratase family protein [Actinomadura spongiicola]